MLFNGFLKSSIQWDSYKQPSHSSLNLNPHRYFFLPAHDVLCREGRTDPGKISINEQSFNFVAFN